MLWFWLGAAVLGGGLSTIVVARAARSVGSGRNVDAEAQLYRRQLTEIDDLAERGLLAPGEVGLARAESGRRLLASLHRSPDAQRADRPRGRWVIVAALLAPGVALALYTAVGEPGQIDQPYGARVSGWSRADPAGLAPDQMAAVLDKVVRERPRDVRALLFLARAQALSGETARALRTLRRAAELDPRRSEVWSLAGELQAGGADERLPDSARFAFERTLALEPQNLTARYYLARDLIARGERSRGVLAWRNLLAELPAGDPRREALEREISQAIGGSEANGGSRLKAGPAETRIIQGMVDGLAERLKARPEDPQGWLRLIRAYGVLGRRGAQTRAVRKARGLFSDRPAILRQIDAEAANLSSP